MSDYKYGNIALIMGFYAFSLLESMLLSVVQTAPVPDLSIVSLIEKGGIVAFLVYFNYLQRRQLEKRDETWEKKEQAYIDRMEKMYQRMDDREDVVRKEHAVDRKEMLNIFSRMIEQIKQPQTRRTNEKRS